jgi:phosphoenolpyruvate synthase/pyruvate phosphate dikinase
MRVVGFDFVYRVDEGVVSLDFVSKEKSEEIIQKINPHAHPKKEIILKGVVVSKGDGKPVTGIARVVTGTDISGIEFNEGDILVTINSSPIYLPLIKKAGALLSEEGGMGCHTAVMGREFNKIGIVSMTDIVAKIKNGTFISIRTDPDLIISIEYI